MSNTRPIVGVRIKPEAIAYVDTLATTEGVNRSEMIRRLLAEALTARMSGTHTTQRVG